VPSIIYLDLHGRPSILTTKLSNAKKQATNDPNAAASSVLLQSTKNMYEDMLRANGISSEETIPLVVLKLGDSSQS
jgi:hypothetical protein